MWKRERDWARRSAVAIRFRATEPTTTAQVWAKSWEKLPNVYGRVGRSLACIRSMTGRSRSWPANSPAPTYIPKSLQWVLSLTYSLFSLALAFGWVRFLLDQNKRASPYSCLVSFPIPTTVYPYAKSGCSGAIGSGRSGGIAR